MGNHRSVRAGSGRWGWRRVAIAGTAAGLAFATVTGIALASGTSTPSVYSSIAPVTVLGKSLAAGSNTDVAIAGVGSVPSNATSVQLSITALSGTTTSSMYVYPTGSTKPTSANVRWQTGETVTIPVTVGVGTGGKVHLATDAGTVTVKVAVVGYFSPAPAAGGVGYSVTNDGVSISFGASQLASLDVAAGTYEVIGKATIDLTSGTADTVECQLADTTGNAFDTSTVAISTQIDLAQLSLTAFDKTTAGGTLTMICGDYTSGATANNIDLVATQLSSATGDIPGS